MFSQTAISLILLLPRWIKNAIVLAVDTCSCLLSVWLAYYFRLGEFIYLSGTAFLAFLIAICIALPVFIVFRIYRAIFRFSGGAALSLVAKAISVYGFLYAMTVTVVGIYDIPRTIGIVQPILFLVFIGASRLFAQFWLDDNIKFGRTPASLPKVLIYGAGHTGRQLLAALAKSHEMRVLGFLDDNKDLVGQVINGKPVYHPADLVNLSLKLNVGVVLLAMPNLSRKRRNDIFDQIRAVRVAVRTVPSLQELVRGKISVSDLRQLDIDDLLGRDPVLPNRVLLARNVYRKVILVTGAGGSIGSEICRQLLSVGPSKLLLIDQSEFALYEIHQELVRGLAARDIELVPLLASVQDGQRMRQIISAWHPDTIYHVAAYKHVMLVEQNAMMGIRNNVFGTLQTAQVAVECNVSNFVLVSTDKAVRSASIMGASKRLAEIVLQDFAARVPITNFCVVRFGNVLGSSGSVVPKFRQQIRDGGPITLSHPEVSRFFMTIPEASQLVIQAGAMAKGGDVFVLDMGESIKISDLARRMIELSGLTVRDNENPNGDIEIKVTGLRPGEKLREEVLISGTAGPTIHPRIMKSLETFVALPDFGVKLDTLKVALNENNFVVVLRMMELLVDDFRPHSEIIDLLHSKTKLDDVAGRCS